MTYVVDVEVINPFGVCLGPNLTSDEYTPWALYMPGTTWFQFYFSNQDGYHAYRWEFRPILDDYIRMTYNLPDDTRILSQLGPVFQSNRRTNDVRTDIEQRSFDTEEEAIEYAESLTVEPATTLENDDILFDVNWTETIGGVGIDRQAIIRHVGDTVVLYTLADVQNYFETIFDREYDIVYQYRGRDANGNQLVVENEEGLEEYWPGVGCQPWIRTRIVNVQGGTTNTITFQPDFSTIPDPNNVTVTIIDGDPVEYRLSNGDGIIEVSDSGNINMRNDGGTFFLNEFGNVGFYASGDASLTAESQVQLGSGGTTFNVDSNGLNMRDSTGTVSFTADELTRLKALLD